MSRSGYIDDDWDLLALGRYRAQVASAMRGRRGQQLLLDLVRALDALPIKELIPNELSSGDHYCALGAVGHYRRLLLTGVEEDHLEIGERLDVAHQLVAEVMYVNDEAAIDPETPAERFARVRRWALRHLAPETLVEARAEPEP